MKKNLFKLILMTALCIILCVAAMPFSVSAEDATEKAKETTAAEATTSGSEEAFAAPTAGSGSAAVTVGSASGKAGDTVTVDVDLNKNPGVIAMTLDVNYDEKQLELVDVKNAGVLNGYNSPSTYGGGSYRLNWEDGLSSTDNNGTGTVARLTFKLKEDCDKASVNVSGKGYNADVDTVSVSGSSGTITNTNPTTTTTTTTTKATTTKPTTAKATTAKATTAKATTTKSSATRSATTPYTRSYNEQNTYPVDFELTTYEEESTTDLLSLWETTTEYWTEPVTEESTTELVEEKEGTSLSKTKLILIVLMACFAIVGIAIIISMVRKSKG